MPNENCVVIKGRKDGLTIALDENVDFKDIKHALKLKLQTARQFYGNEEFSVLFKGRDLSDDEASELKFIISETTDMSVIYIKQSAPAAPRAVQVPRQVRNFEPAESFAGNFKNTELPANTYVEYVTKFINSSLRSGQSVFQAGSVVVVGDVNPGAEIIAEGNIIVLGKLKGLAHAGCRGDHRCFVSALKMEPIQIRIAEKIINMPEPAGRKILHKKKDISPVYYAFIQNGEICFTEL